MTHAPLVRGLFLAALRRPVIVSPTDQEAGIVLDEPLADVAPDSLADVELPVVVSAGGESYQVRAAASGERAITGRVARVTGGAQGFGAEIALSLIHI